MSSLLTHQGQQHPLTGMVVAFAVVERRAALTVLQTRHAFYVGVKRRPSAVSLLPPPPLLLLAPLVSATSTCQAGWCVFQHPERTCLPTSSCRWLPSGAWAAF